MHARLLLVALAVTGTLGQTCTNTCSVANDGDCDDGGMGSEFSLCARGTDCADCGTDRGTDSGSGETSRGSTDPTGVDPGAAQAYIEALWTQVNTDGDDELSLAELEAALVLLEISPSVFTNHQGSASVLFNAYDADSSGGLSMTEMADIASMYQGALVGALTNGAGEIPTSIPAVPTGVTEALARVTFQVEVAGTVQSIFPATRTAIRQYFADLAGVSIDLCIVTFIDVSTAGGRRRKLQGASVRVEATAYVPDQAAADAAREAFPADAAGLGAVPAFSSLTVNSVSVATSATPTIDSTGPVIAAAVLVFVYIFVSSVAQLQGKRGAIKDGATGGMCATGCCSYYAVKPWAMGEVLAIIALAYSLFALLAPAQTLVTSFLSIIDLLIEVIQSDNSLLSQVGSVLNAIPQDAVDAFQANRSTFELLPFVFLAPGIGAIVWMLFASCCAVLPMRKGAFCGSKCMIFFATFAIFQAMGFYFVIFSFIQLWSDYDQLIAQWPQAVDYDPRAAQATVMGTCGTVVPFIQQLVQDNTAAMSAASAAGVDTSTLTQTLADVNQFAGWADQGCEMIEDVFTSIPGLYAPAAYCFFALLLALFTSETLCCAMGCCCAAKSTSNAPVITPKADEPADTLQNI